jgi:purine-binding chemotaxis protein CheW
MKNGSGLDWAGARARMERLRKALGRSPEQREKILRERAARLAQRVESPDSSRTETLMIVAVGGRRFALPMHAVAEVTRHVRCAVVPLAPPEVAGIIEVRGEIRPVFRLSRVVSLPHLPDGAGTAVLLVLRSGRQAGILVDRVEDIRQVAQADRQAAPPGMPHALWLTRDLIPALDPYRIFPEEME